MLTSWRDHLPDGSTRYAYDPPGAGRTQYQYDAIVAVSDTFDGPYSQRWTAGVRAGHNNFFVDGSGHPWATFFRNPNSGYWADPSRIADAVTPSSHNAQRIREFRREYSFMPGFDDVVAATQPAADIPRTSESTAGPNAAPCSPPQAPSMTS